MKQGKTIPFLFPDCNIKAVMSLGFFPFAFLVITRLAINKEILFYLSQFRGPFAWTSLFTILAFFIHQETRHFFCLFSRFLGCCAIAASNKLRTPCPVSADVSKYLIPSFFAMVSPCSLVTGAQFLLINFSKVFSSLRKSIFGWLQEIHIHQENSALILDTTEFLHFASLEEM